jgi:formylglycine-generating enzyme required for sulfatase activity
MRRRASKIVVAAVLIATALIGNAAVKRAMRSAPVGSPPGDDVPCGEGFFRRGPRCCPTPEPLEKLGEGLCSVPVVAPASSAPAAMPLACPAPLVMTERGCDSPERSVVLVPATSVLIGPSDWEAEGRVRPRTVKAGPFEIDRFEVSIGHMRCPTCPPTPATRLAGRDVARAASYVTLDEAREICVARGGRLPTEDEWIVAAAGDKPRRYPWGDTGAVCRRAAWGLTRGPCGSGATGPDTVGAHPDGATPLGIHDLAGNVAEWVETQSSCDAGAAAVAGEARTACLGVVRGGSYDTDLATELRTWVRREVPAISTEPTIGFRCAYDVKP